MANSKRSNWPRLACRRPNPLGVSRLVDIELGHIFGVQRRQLVANGQSGVIQPLVAVADLDAGDGAVRR
jgi:hypothetical protein